MIRRLLGYDKELCNGNARGVRDGMPPRQRIAEAPPTLVTRNGGFAVLPISSETPGDPACRSCKRVNSFRAQMTLLRAISRSCAL